MSFLNSLKANISNFTQVIAESIADSEVQDEEDRLPSHSQDAVVEKLKILCFNQNEEVGGGKRVDFFGMKDVKFARNALQQP